MASVGASELTAHLPDLLERVGRGETITIMEHGRPVAQLTPVPRGEKPTVRETIEAMRAFRDQQGPVLGDLSIRELIEEGRRF
jgi:prevent-host-death family protein